MASLLIRAPLKVTLKKWDSTTSLFNVCQWRGRAGCRLDQCKSAFNFVKQQKTDPKIREYQTVGGVTEIGSVCLARRCCTASLKFQRIVR